MVVLVRPAKISDMPHPELTAGRREATVQAFLSFLANGFHNRLEAIDADLIARARALVNDAELGDLNAPLSPLDD